MAEYDKIAKEYVDAEDARPERIYFIDNSFNSVIGDVKNKKVLERAHIEYFKVSP